MPVELSYGDKLELTRINDNNPNLNSKPVQVEITKEQYEPIGIPFSLSIVDETGKGLDDIELDIFEQIVWNNSVGSTNDVTDLYVPTNIEQEYFMQHLSITDRGNNKTIKSDDSGYIGEAYFESVVGPLEIEVMYSQKLPTPHIYQAYEGDKLITGHTNYNFMENINVYLNGKQISKEEINFVDYYYFEIDLDTPLKKDDVIEIKAVHPEDAKYNSDSFKINVHPKEYRFRINEPMIGDKYISGHGIPGDRVDISVAKKIELAPNEGYYEEIQFEEVYVNSYGYWYIELEKPLTDLESIQAAEFNHDGYFIIDEYISELKEPSNEVVSVSPMYEGDKHISGFISTKFADKVTIEFRSGKKYTVDVESNGKWTAQLEEVIKIDDIMIFYGTLDGVRTKAETFVVIPDKDRPVNPGPVEPSKPIDPEIIDPEIKDPAIKDPEIIDPEIKDPNTKDSEEIIAPENEEKDTSNKDETTPPVVENDKSKDDKEKPEVLPQTGSIDMRILAFGLMLVGVILIIIKRKKIKES